MKKLFLIPLMIVLVSGLISSGYAAADVLKELKFPYHVAGTSSMAKLTHEPFARILEAVTGNKIKVTSYPGATLCKDKEQYDAVASGLADITWQTTSKTKGRFPVTEIMGLPQLGMRTHIIATRVAMSLWDKFPDLFAKEYSDVKLMFLRIGAPQSIWTKSKPIRTIGDLKGMKIRCSSAIYVEAVKLLGGVPVTMAFAEVYDAMSKGIIDGAIADYNGGTIMGLQDVAKYINETGMSSGPSYFIMNLDTWKSLPPEVQQMIWAVGHDVGAEFFCSTTSIGVDQGIEKCKKAGVQISSFSPEEMKKFQKILEPIAGKYVADLNAKGVPGQKLYDTLLKLVEGYNQ